MDDNKNYYMENHFYSREYFKRIEKLEPIIKNKYSDARGTLFDLIDDSYDIFNLYTVGAHLEYLFNDLNAFFMNIFINNIHYVLAAIRLNDAGMYAQARALYRNVYESLVIAKYVYITEDETFIEKYRNGETISLKRILRKIEMSDKNKKIMIDFWDDLCGFSHFSKKSNSMSISEECSDVNIRMSYELAKILLIMNYHVLNSYYFTQSMKDKVSRIIVDEVDGTTVKDKIKDYRILINECMSKMTAGSKRIIRVFSLKWKIKE